MTVQNSNVASAAIVIPANLKSPCLLMSQSEGLATYYWNGSILRGLGNTDPSVIPNVQFSEGETDFIILKTFTGTPADGQI